MTAPQLETVPAFGQTWQLPGDWQPTATQQAQLQQLYAQILAGNRQFNLTRITEPAEFWEKHLWDSLSGIAPWLTVPIANPALDATPTATPDTAATAAAGSAPVTASIAASESASTPDPSTTEIAPEITPDNAWQHRPIQRVIDIGTGGGFPGLPVAIARPDWQVTLLDSTRKKVNFLHSVVEHMGLTPVETCCDRAEIVGRQKAHRYSYDLALIRAVAAAPVCAEYALPLLTVGGVAVLYRGQWTTSELMALDMATRQLGGFIRATVPLETPLTQGVRHCIYVEKIEKTPRAFPREVGVPAKFPLPG